MTTRWWHIIGLLIIGYVIGYYWPALGKMSVGRIMPAAGG